MMTTAFSYLASYIRTYLHEISLGLTAVALMLLGPYINYGMRKVVRKFHWLLRYCAFVFLCTAGYTFILQVVYRGVRHFLQSLSNTVLVVATVALYLLLALAAKEQKAI